MHTRDAGRRHTGGAGAGDVTATCSLPDFGGWAQAFTLMPVGSRPTDAGFGVCVGVALIPRPRTQRGLIIVTHSIRYQSDRFPVREFWLGTSGTIVQIRSVGAMRLSYGNWNFG